MHFKSKTFIISEAGVNHNGDLGFVKKLVDQAKEANADEVQFQLLNAEILTTNWEKVTYQKKLQISLNLNLK